MSDKQRWMNMFLPFIAGVFGGIISILIFNPETLFAKKVETKKAETKQVATKVVTAEEFRLVDKYGKTRAILKSNYTNDAFHQDKEYQDVKLRLIGEKGDVQLTAGQFTSGLEVSQSDSTKDKNLHSSIHISATGAASDISLNYDQPVPKDADSSNVSQASSEDMKIELSANSNARTSNIRLYDDNNIERVNIGNAYVTKKDGTGANYPASSIHLYRNDGKVLWYERE